MCVTAAFLEKNSEKIFILGNGPFWALKLPIITVDLLEEFFLNSAE